MGEVPVLKGMVREFIRQCLFYGSRESFHVLLGTLAWACIFLFVYAVINLLTIV